MNPKTENILNGIAKFTAVFLAILFVLSLVLTLFLYSFEKNAFSAEIYKEALQDEGVYDRLPAIIGDQLVVTMGVDRCLQNPVSCEFDNRNEALTRCLQDALGSEAYRTLSNNERPPTGAEERRFTPCFEEYGYPNIDEVEEGQFTPLAKNLTAKDWELFITALTPPEELKKISEETIDETFAFFNDNTETAEISFHSVKERLTSEEGLNAFMALIEVQPPCTAADLLKLANFFNDEMLFCKPPEASMPLIENFIRAQLKAAATAIPDEKIFLRKTDMGSDFLDAQSLRVLMRLSPLLPMSFLILITLLAVRSLLTWLRWWGIPLLTAGVIALILSMMTGPILQTLFSLPLIEGIPMEVSGSVIQLVYDLLTTIMRRFMGNIALYALLITIFGLGMTVGSTFAKKIEESTEEI